MELETTNFGPTECDDMLACFERLGVPHEYLSYDLSEERLITQYATFHFFDGRFVFMTETAPPRRIPRI